MLTFHQPGVRPVPRRTKPYRNEWIITVIRDMFFNGGVSSYAHRYDALFPRFNGPDGVELREVPEPMVALVATAVRNTLSLITCASLLT
jgi:hypothetical protein